MTRMENHGRRVLPHLASPYKGEGKRVSLRSKWRNRALSYGYPFDPFFLPREEEVDFDAGEDLPE